MLDLIGRQIESYRVEALLGEGGMGAVYRAYDVNLARPVALKIMHPQFAKQAEFQRRFLQEAQAAARLGDHPYIVNIYNFDNLQNLLFMVMEFVPGASLGTYIKRVQEKNQVVKLSETLLLLAQVAEALGYAHRQGVIHRDIKPDNVLLKPIDEPDRQGDLLIRAVVTDFGLAKLLEGGVHTQTGTFMGTLPYMSPEQCANKELDGRSDLYSLGIMLYQLATGQLPFDIKSPTDAIMKHINEVPPAPRIIRPGVPPAVEAVIQRSIEKDPGARYQSGEQMASGLRQAATGLTDADVTRFGPSTEVVSLATQLMPDQSIAEPSRMGFELTALPGQARLLIGRRGENPRAVNLETDRVTIGRVKENDIILEAEGVSRTHARIERSGRGWTVVDLGSTNGTFLENTRLLPDLPEPWEPGKTVRIGPYYLRLEQPEGIPSERAEQLGRSLGATAMARAAIGGTQVHSTTGQLSVVVQPTNVSVDAGGRADIQVELLNQGLTVDHFKLDVKQLPPSWVSQGQESIQLMPGANGSLPVTVQPPRDSSSTAGEHPYTITISSLSNVQDSASVSGRVLVKPFEQFSVDMRPKQLDSGGVCRVLVRNEGNDGATYHVSGRDPGEEIKFERQEGGLRLGPGERGTSDLRLAAKSRPIFGRSKTLPFQIQVGTAGGNRRELPGQLDVNPLLPKWIIPLFALLFLLLCLAVSLPLGFGYLRNQQATQTVDSQLADLAAQQTISVQETQQAEEAAAGTATALAATAQAEGDDDGDGLSNNEEAALGTEPDNPDTDGDGLLDGQEVNQYGTNPKQQDSDGDLLLDGAEVNEHGTSPTNPDTDGDGVPDGTEVNAGTDPVQPPTLTPTPTNTPEATPTASPTSTSTPTPSVTPTPTPVLAQLMAAADRYWLPGPLLFIACLEPPCPTSTPDPVLGEGPELLLKNNEPCAGVLLCRDGLMAVRFDLAPVPPGASIEQATLELTLLSGLIDGLFVSASRANTEWAEDASIRPECDFDNELAAIVGLDPGEYSWDVTGLVQQQQASPADNHGFCLRLSAEGERVFSSREGPDVGRPRLDVVYRP